MRAPNDAQIFEWMQEVADPEIPVLSIVDLGIVRAAQSDVTQVGIECTVTITPTYSGCPAMHEIAAAIEQVLKRNGIASVVIRTRLSPAWTTDWMSDVGKEKLTAYGIAAPAHKVVDSSGIGRKAAAFSVPCPQCGSSHTRCLSQFGSTACKALYQCADCREPFDYFKCH